MTRPSSSRRRGNFGAGLIAGLLALVLASCTNLSLTETYDPQIVQSLNEYHTSFISFMARMDQAGGSAAGAYDGEDARKFYSDTAGILANLIVRAQARNPDGKCIPVASQVPGVTGVLSSSANFSAQNSASQTAASGLADLVKSSADALAKGATQLTSGSCTVVLLQAVKLDQDTLQSMHQRLKHLNPTITKIVSLFISQAVEETIIAEQSKQP